jgi:hypothetical protein
LENYPYDQPIWNVNDQKYWCKMVNQYRYPLASVKELYRYIIEQGKCDTFEEEYAAYQASLSAQPLSEPTEEV